MLALAGSFESIVDPSLHTSHSFICKLRLDFL
jgi:hypothetical protein